MNARYSLRLISCLTEVLSLALLTAKQGQERLLRCREFKSLCVKICFKVWKSCLRKQAGNFHLECHTTKFTPGKFMICWMDAQNWRYRKTKISKFRCVDCWRDRFEVLRIWLTWFNSAHPFGKHTQPQQMTPRADPMQSAPSTSTSLPGTTTETSTTQLEEGFFSLTWLAARELRTLRLIIRRGDRKELRLTSPYLPWRSAFEPWTKKSREGIFLLDKRSLLWLFETPSLATRVSQGSLWSLVSTRERTQLTTL